MEPAVKRRNDLLKDFKVKFKADVTAEVKKKLLDQGQGQEQGSGKAS